MSLEAVGHGRGRGVMMEALMRLKTAILDMSSRKRLWLEIACLAHLAGFFCFAKFQAAWAVLFIYLVCLYTAVFLIHFFGVTRLLGLAGLPRVLLIFHLLPLTQILAHDHLLYLWLQGIILLNIVSLTFNVIDLLRYLKGDHSYNTAIA